MKTLHDRREDLCYKFVAKAMKQHPHLYPKDVNAKTTRQGGKTHLEIPKYTTDLHKKSGKVSLGLIYNKRLDEKIREQGRIGEAPLPTNKRKARCKKCPGCIKDDCGTCEYCKYMKKFGGPGRKKQACAERNCSAGY